jgi:uncharacterized membrane protein
LSPTAHLALAAALFLASHYVSSTPLRAKLVARLGNAYLALYSLAAFAAQGYLIWAYLRAPPIGLWYLPALRYVPLVVMPFAFVLAATALMTRNPTAVMQERTLDQGEPARGILRVTRHPLMWGIGLWAASHIVARGDAASLIFFGTFLLLAVSGTVLIDRRKRVQLGDGWRRFAAVTSNIPFAAIADGRNHLDLAEIGWPKAGAGLALYALLLWLHPSLFGARPY